MTTEQYRIAGVGLLLVATVFFVGHPREETKVLSDTVASLPRVETSDDVVKHSASESLTFLQVTVTSDARELKTAATSLALEPRSVTRGGYNGLLGLWVLVIALFAYGHYYDRYDPLKEPQFPKRFSQKETTEESQ